MAKKVINHLGISRDEAEKAMAEYAQSEAKLKSIQAKIEAEFNKVREKYAEQIVELEMKRDECFDIVAQYASENRNELFQDKKKVEWVHGIFGFRTGSPKLKAVKGLTWANVVERCREFLPEYIKTTYDVAKSKILADRNHEGMSDAMEKAGIEVVQDETFYLDAK